MNVSSSARKILLPACLVALQALPTARAVIVKDYANNDPLITSAPANGAPWAHVASVGTVKGSAVYLGNGYLLTAEHVGLAKNGSELEDITIDGAAYAQDRDYGIYAEGVPFRIGGLNIDLTVIRILGDPQLPVLEIAGESDSDLNTDVTLIGWGVGKGTVTADGWYWGGDSTRDQRWGTNRTRNSRQDIIYNIGKEFTYDSLPIVLNKLGVAATEAGITLGDSGSGMFASYNNTWKLLGVATVAFNPTEFKSFQPQENYTVPVKDYAHFLRYDHWKDHYNISQATPDNDDSDGDGVPLLLEYALGMDPGVNGIVGLPTASFDGSNLVVTYTRLASTTDIEVIVEESDTLSPGSWTDSLVTPALVSRNDLVWTMRASIPLDGATMKFARLRVNKL